MQRNGYPWWFAGALLIVVVTFCLLPATFQSKELLLSVVGGVAAFFHFLYAQHNHNTERFIGLFREFNARYDSLNSEMNELASLPSGEIIFKPEQIQTLYDYFNLCAEEYLYFRAGYVDLDVWCSWSTGMAYFAACPEIRRIWQHELEHGSYYGFKLKLIECPKQRIVTPREGQGGRVIVEQLQH